MVLRRTVWNKAKLIGAVCPGGVAEIRLGDGFLGLDLGDPLRDRTRTRTGSVPASSAARYRSSPVRQPDLLSGGSDAMLVGVVVLGVAIACSVVNS
jgi:hypothetical protein